MVSPSLAVAQVPVSNHFKMDKWCWLQSLRKSGFALLSKLLIANCERIASWHRLGIFSQLVAGA
jgi:hypothetical protein